MGVCAGEGGEGIWVGEEGVVGVGGHGEFAVIISSSFLLWHIKENVATRAATSV